MSRDLDDLVTRLGFTPSAEQQAAITYPLTPAIVHAGAGTGKTTVMAARVAWLVGTGQVEPDRVLGLTFTRKAAGELAGRVQELLPDLDAEPTIATYHSFARDLLMTHGARIGLDAEGDPLDEPTAFQLARTVVSRIDDAELDWHSSADALAAAVVALDSELAEHLVEPEQLESATAKLLGELALAPRQTAKLIEMTARTRSRQVVTSLVSAYRGVKLDRGLFDFGDYLRFGASLALVPGVVAALREQYQVVLLDEYQDTSYSQEQILLRLFGAGHAITAVGDPHQSIYGFRGASAANMRRFQVAFAGDTPAVRFPLTQNRRSDAAIVDAANAITAGLREPSDGGLVAKADAMPGSVTVALHDREIDEVDWIVAQVAAYRESAAVADRSASIAVLSRTRAGFPALYQALTEAGIPVEVVGLGGLLEVPDVAEIVAMLRVLNDPAANPALLRLLRGPRWRIGQRDLRLLARRANEIGGGRRREAGTFAQQLAAQIDTFEEVEVVALLDAVDDPGDAPYDPTALARFAELSERLRTLRRSMGLPLPELVHRIGLVIGLEADLLVGADSRSRRSAYGKFLDKVATFAPLDGPPTVRTLLAWFDVHSGREDEPEPEAPDDAASVQLMTIHAAKGLEFDFVALPFVSQSRFPGTPTGVRAARWPTGASKLPNHLRGDAADLPQLTELSNAGLDAFIEASREHEAREERRLMYVAATRARHALVACGSWWGPSQVKKRGPSEFLMELATSAVVESWAEEPDADRNPYLVEPPEVRPEGDGVTPERAAVASIVRDLLPDASSGQAVAPDEGLTADEQELLRGLDELARELLAEEQADRRSERIVRLPQVLSASQLIDLVDDPDRFARDLYRPMPRPVRTGAKRGTAFHTWVAARMGTPALIDPDELPGAADATDPDLVALMAAFERLPYASRSPIAVEEPVAIRLAGRTVVGRIDAVFKDGDRWEIVDWKTGSPGGTSELQLGIYRLAWAEAHDIDPAHVVGRFVHVATGVIDERGELITRADLAELISGSPG